MTLRIMLAVGQLLGPSVPDTHGRPHPPTVREMRLYTIRTAFDNHIDPALPLHIAKRESGWNPYALNRRSGCVGVMQLSPWVVRLYGIDGYDWRANVRVGVGLLAVYEHAHKTVSPVSPTVRDERWADCMYRKGRVERCQY